MTRSRALGGLGLIVLLSPVITWWLVGDLSEDVYNPDFVAYPPNLTSTQELAIGASATLIGALALGTLVSPPGRRVLCRGDVGIVVPLVCLGAFLGCAFRVTTAGVGGANIGAGLVFMFGVVFVPAMIAAAYIQLLRATPTPPASEHRSPSPGR